jgi:hypothetical protein
MRGADPNREPRLSSIASFVPWPALVSWLPWRLRRPWPALPAGGEQASHRPQGADPQQVVR